jgi:hypothetical protein
VTQPGQMTLDGRLEQQRREDAKAENTVRLVFAKEFLPKVVSAYLDVSP